MVINKLLLLRVNFQLYAVDLLNSKYPNRKSGLNGKYISEGIYRFVSSYYSSYHTVNGMIGFIVEPIDIHQNITCINKLIATHFTNANIIIPLTKRQLKANLDFTYFSTHSVGNSPITLYHLMLDFSNNF